MGIILPCHSVSEVLNKNLNDRSSKLLFVYSLKLFITLANLYTQIDEYVQKMQYWDVQIYQFNKHSDTNLRFYLISRQLKLQTSGNSYIQFCMHTCSLLYKFLLLRFFSIIINFLHHHGSKFITIVDY